MTHIQIFDPPLCCSTGICGVNVEQNLVTFAADLEWAKQQGGLIERYNLAQQPLEFANHPQVRSYLVEAGQEGLPLILLNGEIVLTGRYPQRHELASWVGVAATAMPIITLQKSGSCCCDVADKARDAS